MPTSSPADVEMVSGPDQCAKYDPDPASAPPPGDPTASSGPTGLLHKAASDAGDAITHVATVLDSIKGFFTNFRSPEEGLKNFTHWLTGQLVTNNPQGQVMGYTGADGNFQPCGDAASLSGLFQSSLNPGTSARATPPGGHGAGRGFSVPDALFGWDAQSTYHSMWNAGATATLLIAGLTAIFLLLRATFRHEKSPAHQVALDALLKLALCIALISPFAFNAMYLMVDVSGKMGVSAFAAMTDQAGGAGALTGVFVLLAKLALAGIFVSLIAKLAHLYFLLYFFLAIIIAVLFNILYLFFLLIVRLVVLGFVFATAPIILPLMVFMGTGNRYVRWWTDIFVGSLMVPVVVGFGFGATILMASKVLSIDNQPLHDLAPFSGIMFLVILVGGCWFTHRTVSELTVGHYHGHGSTLAALVGGTIGGFLGGSAGVGAAAGGGAASGGGRAGAAAAGGAPSAPSNYRQGPLSRLMGSFHQTMAQHPSGWMRMAAGLASVGSAIPGGETELRMRNAGANAVRQGVSRLAAAVNVHGPAAERSTLRSAAAQGIPVTPAVRDTARAAREEVAAQRARATEALITAQGTRITAPPTSPASAQQTAAMLDAREEVWMTHTDEGRALLRSFDGAAPEAATEERGPGIHHLRFDAFRAAVAAGEPEALELQTMVSGVAIRSWEENRHRDIRTARLQPGDAPRAQQLAQTAARRRTMPPPLMGPPRAGDRPPTDTTPQTPNNTDRAGDRADG